MEGPRVVRCGFQDRVNDGPQCGSEADVAVDLFKKVGKGLANRYCGRGVLCSYHAARINPSDDYDYRIVPEGEYLLWWVHES